jgi:cytochrome c-type biogenesis protein
MADITLPAVFLAGLASFLSPCVLPLVPPYLTYLAGATIDEISGDAVDRAVRRRAVTSALFFMAGLATIFISLGASASLVGSVLVSARRGLAGLLAQAAGAGMLPMNWAVSIDPFALIAGIIIIAMGLHFLGVFRIAMLYRQARFESRVTPGPWGAYVMGLAFAFGWTPCIGPVLATVLAVAGREASVGQGAFLLAIYTAGLGLPFVIAAFAMNPFMGFLRRFRTHLGTVEKVMGGLLVVAGLAFLTGGMADFSVWLQSTFPVLTRLG